MKDMITNSLIGLAIIILLFLCFVAYLWQPYGQRMYLRGCNNTINSVLTQLQKRKEVTIDTQNGEIVLIPKIPKKADDKKE